MTRSIRRELAAHPRRERVVDIGCGTGEHTALLASMAGEVVGIDNNQAKIRKAVERHPGIKFNLAEAAKTGFPDGYFDTAFMIMSLHEAFSDEVIKEACRIAGELVIIDYARVLYGFRKKLVEFIEREKYTGFAAVNLAGRLAQFGYALRESRRIHPSLYIYFFAAGRAGRKNNVVSLK
jgi:ubiquinone/menaquinone biosynthesis C-methylase UbiE